MRTCHLCGPNCEYETLKTCFACGLPACGTCTLVLPYYSYGKRRVCNRCLSEHFDNGADLAAWNEYHNAGHEKTAMPVPVQYGKVAGTNRDASPQPFELDWSGDDEKPRKRRRVTRRKDEVLAVNVRIYCGQCGQTTEVQLSLLSDPFGATTGECETCGEHGEVHINVPCSCGHVITKEVSSW